mgnify:CR=1 FL=1
MGSSEPTSGYLDIADHVSARPIFLFQAEGGIRDLVRSRGLGDVYKRQDRADVSRGEGVAEVLADSREAGQ